VGLGARTTPTAEWLSVAMSPNIENGKLLWTLAVSGSADRHLNNSATPTPEAIHRKITNAAVSLDYLRYRNLDAVCRHRRRKVTGLP